MIANVIFFVGIAIVGGLGTSWLMIDKGSPLTTRASGPWVMWTEAGRADADPYTRAHFMRRGLLPISTTLSHAYQANADSGGELLYSSCDYVIEGREPDATFWTLSVFDEHGRNIPNAADRHSFNSATLMRTTTNKLDVRLARNARPGNWLPTGGAGRISLLLTLDEPRKVTTPGTNAEVDAPQELPTIRRLTCR